MVEYIYYGMAVVPAVAVPWRWIDEPTKPRPVTGMDLCIAKRRDERRARKEKKD